MHIPQSPEIDFALSAVETGMRLCRQLQAGNHHDSLTKTDASPVTIADYSVQAITGAMLAECRSTLPLVAEESSAALREPENEAILGLITDLVGKYYRPTSPEEVCAWIDQGASAPGEQFWVMDPVDGTKGFIRGGQYVVALAKIEGGSVVVSVLGCPNLDERMRPDLENGGTILMAVRGEGAWARSLEGSQWTRLHVSAQRESSLARIAHSFEPTHTNQGRLKDLLEALDTQVDTIPMDSQAKYAMIAGGACDLLYRLTSSGRPPGAECIWDHAIGALIVEEAGGQVTDLHGKELDFTQGRTLAANEGVLVSNRILHTQALEVYRQVTRETG